MQTESIAVDWDLLLNELRFRKDLNWDQEGVSPEVHGVSECETFKQRKNTKILSQYLRLELEGKSCGIEFV